MAEEKVYLDETFAVVKYNNTAPMAGLPLLKRREYAQTTNVRVIVTNKRIIVDEKMTVLANVAAVSVGDDEREVVEHNAGVQASRQQHEARAKIINEGRNGIGHWILLILLGALSAVAGFNDYPFFAIFLGVGGIIMFAALREDSPWNAIPELTPDYVVVIESAGTRDNALVSKDRMVVRKIVRAISDALVGAEPDAGAASPPGRAALP